MTVYICARDLNGLPLGTHQFIVITYPSSTAIKIAGNTHVTKLLGPKTHGIVFGAQNKGALRVEVFEQADTIAAQEYFGSLKKVWYKSDYDAEMNTVFFNGSTFSLHHERKLISNVNAYYENQTLDLTNPHKTSNKSKEIE